MVTALRHKLLIIQDNTLVSMAGQVRFTKEFPFLKSLNRLKSKTPGKKRCCNSSNNRASETFAAAKRTLAGLPKAKKDRLRVLLSAKKLRVVYRDPNGKHIQLTF